jgi:hypothetical protein
MAIEWKAISVPPVDPARIDPKADRARRDALRDLLEPGVVLMTTSGKTVLVGDINPRAGTCDCCGWGEDDNDPVVKWARVWPPTETASAPERATS